MQAQLSRPWSNSSPSGVEELRDERTASGGRTKLTPCAALTHSEARRRRVLSGKMHEPTSSRPTRDRVNR
ncbi:hypothetical protein EYF80_054453 [Liparis tanakae]|uniref:Uncharacterized protein n=1 Tax=Liparis tanakae TaxID=230148 RepID=A0A4Z2F2K2_9TELE|nr:hypothetical protein EYF80_054453 [Liparis tanakae]